MHWDSTTDVTGWFFPAGALRLRGGAALLPRRVGAFLRGGDFPAGGTGSRSWSWPCRVRQFGVAVRALLALAALLASCSRAFALDPALDVSQYGHTSWKVREGLFKDSISSITQTPDGYLWLGTQFGPLRFDGVRYVLWQPPAGQQLPSSYIRSLYAARDGRLWIGTQLGLASWKDGKLTLHPELAGQAVGRILEDREGTVWAGTRHPPPGKLCAFRSGSAQCYGEGGEFGDRASSLYEDRSGNLWVGAQTGLWRWKPGPPKRYPLADFESSQGVVETDNGALLIAERCELKQLIDEKVVAYHLPVEGLRFQPSRLLRDRDGGLWIGTFDRGLVHVHQGRADLFSRLDGLSGNYIRDLFEDREGNIWVGTANGLDRFRHTSVTTVSVNQGLSHTTPWSLLTARDGSVWVGTLDGLNRLKDGQITIYRKRSRSAKRDPAGTVREITDGGLPDDLIHSLFEDDRRRIWVSTHAGVAYFENDRFTPVGGIPAGVHAIAGDAAGNIWISEAKSLFQVRAGRVVGQFPWAALGRNTPAIPMLSDPVRGGLWLGFRDGTGVAYCKDGTIRAAYGAAEGLGRGMVGNLHLDADGTLWAATEGGLSRLKDGRVHTLTAKNGLPGDGVSWVTEDDRSFWLYTSGGLARVARPEVEAWAAAVEKDKEARPRVKATIFDHADGVRIHAAPGGYTPQVGKTPDGRVWFLPWDGVSVMDPRRLPFNPLPPPVHIEQITADGEAYDALPGLRLPPLVRDLAIDYTALSLAAPEKIRFRYKLEGQDPEWKEVAGERRAHYSNLPPGHYRFRVSACNNSGVWNEQGASLDFAIAPAYYQTNGFRALCVAAFLALVQGLYQWRIRQVRRHEKQLRAVIEGMPTMAFTVRPDGSSEFVNQRWLAYSGLSTDATVVGRSWEATIHPDDVEVHLNKWRAALATGEPFENEARHRGAGGEYRWFLVRAVPFRNKQGKIVKWYGTLTDIEDRKRAEEQQRASLREMEALLKEVHHRVKNNLQLICSLLSLQAARVKDSTAREALTDSRDRVRSMSLVHENLYQASSFAGVPLARQLETLCTHLIRSYTGGGSRIELQARLADVTIDLDRAVPLMLIVNELVSNALKHAFPGDRAGRVSVELLCLPGARDRVVVTDNGVGLPPDFDPRRVSSLGLQLVADLTEQLHGTIDVRSDGGTTFTLTFDAARGTDRQP